MDGSKRKRKKRSTGIDLHDKLVQELAQLCATFEHSHYIHDILTTVVKMGIDKTDNVDLKMVSTALKELRYSFLKFSAYRSIPKVTLFGSARSKPKDPEYLIAEEFARKMVEHNYMIITGAGPGIMEAGNKGAGPNKSFGVNIHLPFEQEPNPYIIDSDKLINFHYFFTRKLIFIKESCATVVCPGGFGTLDEAFENITLFQTGKSAPRPIILLEPEGFGYWKDWLKFVKNQLGRCQYMSESDLNIFTCVCSADEAVQEILQFKRVYHSIRHIGEYTVLRLKHMLHKDTMKEINVQFKDMFGEKPELRPTALPPEIEANEYPDLPRLVLHFKNRDYGRLKQLIDLINKDKTE